MREREKKRRGDFSPTVSGAQWARLGGAVCRRATRRAKGGEREREEISDTLSCALVLSDFFTLSAGIRSWRALELRADVARRQHSAHCGRTNCRARIMIVSLGPPLPRTAPSFELCLSNTGRQAASGEPAAGRPADRPIGRRPLVRGRGGDACAYLAFFHSSHFRQIIRARARSTPVHK